MEYLPLLSILYGLFLLALSASFRYYSLGEFSMLIYGIFFIGFGSAMFLIRVGMDFGLPFDAHANMLWFFSTTFLATSIHLFFKVAVITKQHTRRIEKVYSQEVEKIN